MTLRLTCHPSTPCPCVREVAASIDTPGNNLLVFYFRIEGDIGGLRLPAPVRPERAEELWKHTCFEAFMRVHNARAYFELNVSPSGQWAAYRFDDYRKGMSAITPSRAPVLVFREFPDRLEADINVHLAAFEGLDANRLQLGVSAVLEKQDGEISCWALAHPPGKPDFHHSAGFALTLPAGLGKAR